MANSTLFQEAFVAQILSTWSNIHAPETWIRAVYHQAVNSRSSLDLASMNDNSPLLGIVQGKTLENALNRG